MPSHDRIARVLHDHVAVIRDSFSPQSGVIVALAQRLTEGFQQGGKLFICGSGPLTAVADLTTYLFLYRLSIERPALPAVSLGNDATLLHALSRDGMGRQVYARQLRACATESDILLVFADIHPDPALAEALAAAQHLGMTTAAVVPAKFDFAGGDPPPYLFRLDSAAPGRIAEAAVVFGHLLCELVEAELFGT